tara:strand:+ start:576 stop:785 length:210 start_codon:yes stop_codon:yes gene_type:complete
MSDINIELNDYATANTCLGKVASTGKFADKHPMRILVAEDNPFNKMFIDKLFENLTIPTRILQRMVLRC